MKTIAQKQLNGEVFVAAVLVLSFVLGLSVLAKSDTGMEASDEHRSAISTLAKELNSIANRDGGIGKELREVAKAQEDSKEEVAEAIEEVENRNWLKTFFVGTDYKNIGDLRSAVVTTDNHINRLTKASDRAVNPATASDIEEQIAALKAEKAKIEAFIKENESKFSLFGWFVKLFSR